MTEAQAAYLGGLSGFSAGALSLTLSANAAISVADANALGSLGSAFKLGGFHLDVTGTVAAITAATVEAPATSAASTAAAIV